MNKNVSPIAQSDFFNQEYIPTKTFMEYLAKMNDFPYASELSFEPYLNKLDSLSHGQCSYTKSAISPMFKNSSYLSKMTVEDIQKMDNEKLQNILGGMFPYMFLNQQRSFVASPFKKELYFQTPATIELFNSGDWMIKLDLLEHKANKITTTIRAGTFLLNKFYNIDIDDPNDQIFTLKNVKTGLEKHFEIQIKNDFVEAEKLKPLRKLNKKKISELLNNIYDEDLWLEAFPPENFKFKGFLIGTFHDVTGMETMSILKNKITLSEEEMNPEFFFPFVEQQLKNYLQMPDLRIGMVMITFAQFFRGQAYSLLDSNDMCFIKGDNENTPSIYNVAFKKKKPILFDDLTQLDNSSPVVQKLLNKNIKGLILLPLLDDDGELSSILEIGIPEAMKFNALTLLQLKEFFDLMNLGADRYMQDMENMINMFIQQQFTSIHSSVKWKFEEVATKYEVQRSLPNFDGSIEPILFEHVYPLYGQADIVSSSTLRNESIKKDLLENLEQVHELMKIWNDHIKFHLMESYIVKIDQIINRIEKEFYSSDESLIVELLTTEIHPLLKQLKSKFDSLPSKPYEAYLSLLDQDLHIIYNHRKDYEQSVTQLNTAISNFLEKDDARMQKILPHYFEKYKTDGIEYNIYLGEAILKNGGFSSFFLKDFRIWQLVNACEITRLVETLSSKLPVPLKTAQLLFVYNSSLSIRFRMDEKQFDVDGSYNVRYEILKKRIDKAIIKGTNERLTVAGKVAIVYLQEKDRLEYLEYFEYLKQKNYILPEIEDVELDKLQGAEGLKALRISVNLEKAQ
jgi:hypothetical protein